MKYWRMHRVSQVSDGGKCLPAEEKSRVMLSRYMRIRKHQLKHTESYRVNARSHKDKTLNSVEDYEER